MRGKARVQIVVSADETALIKRSPGAGKLGGCK